MLSLNTSTLADSALYESEVLREYRHTKRVPTVEQQEIRKIYQQKGFEGELLDRIVDTIIANGDVWVAVMMAEEHQLSPVNRSQALRSALVVGVSAIVGSLIPLIPFVIFPIAAGIPTSILLSALVLFALGLYKARITIGHPVRSGLEMAIIGTVSALAGYAVGLVLKVPMIP